MNDKFPNNVKGSRVRDTGWNEEVVNEWHCDGGRIIGKCRGKFTQRLVSIF